MRALIQIAYVVRRQLLRWLRVRTHGVKVMLFNSRGELLLIRNSYGNRGLYVLPGGGIARREAPAEAAAREIREELGIEVAELELVATYVSRAEGKRDTVHMFRAETRDEPDARNFEIEEARFFALDALPECVSPATLRRIAELKSGRRSGVW